MIFTPQVVVNVSGAERRRKSIEGWPFFGDLLCPKCGWNLALSAFLFQLDIPPNTGCQGPF